MTFDELFSRATHRTPFPFQRALALAPDLPEALSAPTGAGKTAAVVLAWLYRRRFAPPEIRRVTPRRLLLCLPMRTLAIQTAGVVTAWLRALDLHDEGPDLDRGDGVGVHLLMGGHEPGAWHLHPERDAVLVGTQDMLLSRALNRGYGQSRFLWPWLYALVTNDCFWIFDEVQLMGIGLATGLQLSAFRRTLGAFGPAHAIFMSATLGREWLATVDHPAPGSVMTLGDEDLATPDLARRRRAAKRLDRTRTAIDKDCKPALAEEVVTGRMGSPDHAYPRHPRGGRGIVGVLSLDDLPRSLRTARHSSGWPAGAPARRAASSVEERALGVPVPRTLNCDSRCLVARPSHDDWHGQVGDGRDPQAWKR